jgi:hypothetical protein
MNLFLESMKHLHEPTKKEEQPIEESPDRLKFLLGKGKSFDDPDLAYVSLLEQPVKPLPEKYRNSLTKSFHNGSEEGQLQTIFKDWKVYRQQIQPKIGEFFTWIKLNPDKCPVFIKYVGFLQHNLDPRDVRTFIDGGVDLGYFKFWCLLKNFNENRSSGSGQ